MKRKSKAVVFGLLLVFAALPAVAQDRLTREQRAQLDELYGIEALPAYIKHYEVDNFGSVMLNPYIQVGYKNFPAVIDSRFAPYNWCIGPSGHVNLIQEAEHPNGYTYPTGFTRPEDQRTRTKKTVEKFGHTSGLGGLPARICGEFLWSEAHNVWVINTKSGRYTKHNEDRTPEQFANAVKLIQQTVTPLTGTWGPAAYLLEYAPERIRDFYMKSPDLKWDDEAKKSRPQIRVFDGWEPVKFQKMSSLATMDAMIRVAEGPKQETKQETKKETEEKNDEEEKSGYDDVEKTEEKKGKVLGAHDDDPS